MNRSCSRGASALSAVMVLTIPACGQSVVEPERVPSVEQVFAASASGARLRCTISPVRPTLSFDFHFHTGYTIEFPLAQFFGSGHGLNIHARVTPEGRAPVYLTHTNALPEVPDSRLDGQTAGSFVVGEGKYAVEVLVEDDQQRFCRGTWQIQARRTASERQLKPTSPSGAVEELSGSQPLPPASNSSPRIARLTVLVHAAPLSPNLSQLQPDDVQRLADSLSSLLRELPARRVRLIAFNLDQRAVIFRKDGFEANQRAELTAALNHLQLGLFDYRVMRERPKPMALLLGLVQTELRDTKPPDALILLGPPSRMRDDVPADLPGGRAAASPPVFSLQYRVSRPLLPGRGGDAAANVGRARSGQALSNPVPIEAPIPTGIEDSIERLVGRLKGQTIPVRTPHDLADAIQRMDARIVRTATPAETTARVAPAAVERPVPKVTPPPQATESTGDEDPVDVMVRLREQVLKHGDRIPNHTCAETIRRDRYEPASGLAPKSCPTLLARREEPDYQARLKLDRTDWLHLDVALAAIGEIYSWAGASRFEEGDIDELVPEGAIGTGPFAAMLLSIFEFRGPMFTFSGEKDVDDRRLFEYGFAVSRQQSHYRIKAHKEWVTTGYSGTMLVDPKTAELVRLIVRTEELPPETSSCETDTFLEYGVVQLGATDYLLPKAARQRFIGRNGDEAENTVSFSACREYQAESKLAFGGGAPGSQSEAGMKAVVLDLPEGLPVTVELTTAVRPGEAGAGDRIEGRLAAPIRDAKQRTLVPEGTAVQGRLMRVEALYSSRPQVTVALRWETVQVGSAMAPVALLPNRRPPDLRTSGAGGLRRRGMEIELPLPSESQYGVFHIPGGRVLESGFQSEWITAKP